jgi:membrane-associated protease RseP (regulator of RpoE activity)
MMAVVEPNLAPDRYFDPERELRTAAAVSSGHQPVSPCAVRLLKGSTMNAFTAAKRPLWVMLSVVLLIGATAALAADKEESGYLGVMLQDLSPSMAKALQLGDQTGVLVNDVVDDSPAAKAGLEEGDLILEFNGVATPDPKALTKAVRKTSPGDEVQVVVLREGKKKTLDVEVGEREADNVMFFSSEDGDAPDVEFFTKKGNKVMVMGKDGHTNVWTHGDDDFTFENVMFFGDRGYLGVHLDDLGEQLGEYFDVKDGKGALVTEVVADSPAAKAGLKAGDVIVAVGDEAVASAGDVHEAMSATEADQEVAIEVKRKGKSKNFTVTLAEMPADAFARHIKITTDDNDFTWHAPRMKKHELHRDQEELQEMRDELDKMRDELDKMRGELKK